MNNSIEAWNEHEQTDISKPTEEEYLKAKEEMSTFAKWVRLARNRQTELIDSLAVERENEKLYLGMYEKNKDIVSRYEIYEELEQRQSKK